MLKNSSSIIEVLNSIGEEKISILMVAAEEMIVGALNNRYGQGQQADYTFKCIAD